MKPTKSGYGVTVVVCEKQPTLCPAVEVGGQAGICTAIYIHPEFRHPFGERNHEVGTLGKIADDLLGETPFLCDAPAELGRTVLSVIEFRRVLKLRPAHLTTECTKEESGLSSRATMAPRASGCSRISRAYATTSTARVARGAAMAASGGEMRFLCQRAWARNALKKAPGNAHAQRDEMRPAVSRLERAGGGMNPPETHVE